MDPKNDEAMLPTVACLGTLKSRHACFLTSSAAVPEKDTNIHLHGETDSCDLYCWEIVRDAAGQGVGRCEG